MITKNGSRLKIKKCLSKRGGQREKEQKIIDGGRPKDRRTKNSVPTIVGTQCH